MAAELAQKHQAKLVLLTAYNWQYAPEVTGAGMVATTSANIEQEKEFAENIVAAAAVTAKAAGADNVVTLAQQGDPTSAILKAADAEKADMIVLGSHGHGTLVGLLLGSVSTKVTSHAKCTCIVVR
jgi:nucleotide-binding universal stress UspA family protein